MRDVRFANPEITEEWLAKKVQEQLKEGMMDKMPQSLEDLTCSEYTDAQIEEDSKLVDFDKAYEEARQLEDLKR